MKRLKAAPWADWQDKLEKVGFVFHSLDAPYWNSEYCYEFNDQQIDLIEKATNDLQDLCTDAITKVIEKGWYERLGLGAYEISLIEASWNADERSIYGRFDLAWSGGSEVKMLEYNADTPTSLLEASVAQWLWLQDQFPKEDQFNSIHEKLIARWKAVASSWHPLYFTALRDSVEDICQTEYLRDTATQADLKTEFIFLDEIGWHTENKKFVDLDEKVILQAFKLYPWEWMVQEEFGKNIKGNLKLIEPAWKMLLSNKALLPILWELYPNHPLLLPAFFEKQTSGKFVKKPFLSREGANISIVDGNKTLVETDGAYSEGKFIYQAYHELPKFDGVYTVTGSWIIGEVAAGIGLREDTSPITQNLSQFTPHYFRKS